MKSFILAITALFCAGALNAEVIVLSGVYQGKDLYVKNPLTSSGVGYCVFEILVNGQITNDEVNAPSFAIDLGAFGFKEGTPVEITIRCKEDCPVKILNPEAIYPTSTFEITDISIAPDGKVRWKTAKEGAAIPFAIEQFKWNRWIKVGEVQGLGGGVANEYEFDLYTSSGENLIRVSQLDYKGTRYSQVVSAKSAKEPIRMNSMKISKTIDFSAETDYEIYSEFGALVKAGRSNTVDVSKLFKGRYYVNYDNQTGIAIDKK